MRRVALPRRLSPVAPVPRTFVRAPRARAVPPIGAAPVLAVTQRVELRLVLGLRERERVERHERHTSTVWHRETLRLREAGVVRQLLERVTDRIRSSTTRVERPPQPVGSPQPGAAALPRPAQRGDAPLRFRRPPDGSDERAAHPGREPGAALAPGAPARGAPAPPDPAALAERVLRELDRRVLAERERRGRV
jgi:hypothetical protein